MSDSSRRQVRVDNPSDAYWAFDPFAVVKPGDPWYVDLSEFLEDHRYGLGSKLKRHLRPSPAAPDFVQLAVLGQSGVGKTTQVRGAVGNMSREEVFPVMIDALNELDTSDLEFADLLFTLARSVLDALVQAEIDVPEEEAELLEAYFADETYIKTESRGASALVETEAEAKGGVPLLAKLLGRFRGSMKAESDYRREVRQAVQRDPKELIRRVNYLLDATTKVVQERHGERCRLLVVVDNLEKFPTREVVERSVIRRAAELRELRCHLIVFLHPADEYNPGKTVPSQMFQKLIRVPALPIRESSDRTDYVDPACIEAVRALLDKRVDLSAIFEDSDQALEALLRHSGDHLRHVLDIAREACEFFAEPKVGTAEIDAAAEALSRTHNARIRPGDWPRLRKIAEENEIANDGVDGYLLLHLLVLEYNGQNWWDVHPYVRRNRHFDAPSPSQ